MTLATHTPTPEEDAAWAELYTEARAREEMVGENVVSFPGGRKLRVVWSPQPGSQVTFMQCPLFEALLHGSRGSGKTDVLLMSFAQHVGRGHGDAWRGVIFRKTYPELADIVAKSERWFRLIFPEAQFNKASHAWTWPGGEVLMFRHMARPSDYWHYHGAELPFIGWEELCTWADDQCYRPMFSCCRTSRPQVPLRIRATTNPYGVGASWVRERFGLYGRWWETQVIEAGGKHRAAIHAHLRENRVLLAAIPDYADTIAASATNPAMQDAWLRGDWDVAFGGMFDDLWKPEHNVVAHRPLVRLGFERTVRGVLVGGERRLGCRDKREDPAHGARRRVSDLGVVRLDRSCQHRASDAGGGCGEGHRRARARLGSARAGAARTGGYVHLCGPERCLHRA